MSRLQKPLNERVLWSTGDLILWAELDLLLKDDFGNWQAKTFRVDSATDMTTLPAYDAQGVTHEPTGLPIRSGFIRCRVVGLDQTEHVFPCFFLGEPNAPPPPGTAPSRTPRYLLGLSGVVDKIRWTFDATPASLQAPHGYLTVEKI